MTKINNYKELIVWQKSMDLVDLVYKINKQLPSEERFILTSQTLRAAISIPSNIAEGFGRRTQKDKKQFLTISYASSLELETQIEIIRRNYSDINITKAVELITEVQKMLNALIIRIF